LRTLSGMSEPGENANADRVRRWFGLLISVAIGLLLLSIYSPGQSRWMTAFHVVGAILIWVLGIYDFRRHQTAKRNG